MIYLMTAPPVLALQWLTSFRLRASSHNFNSCAPPSLHSVWLNRDFLGCAQP